MIEILFAYVSISVILTTAFFTAFYSFCIKVHARAHVIHAERRNPVLVKAEQSSFFVEFFAKIEAKKLRLKMIKSLPAAGDLLIRKSTGEQLLVSGWSNAPQLSSSSNDLKPYFILVSCINSYGIPDSPRAVSVSDFYADCYEIIRGLPARAGDSAA